MALSISSPILCPSPVETGTAITRPLPTSKERLESEKVESIITKITCQKQ